MTAQETDEEAVPAEASAAGGLREQLGAFPWPVGVVTGAGAFLAGYVVVAAYALASGASVGSGLDAATVLGFAFYNAHGLLVVAETGPNVVAPSVDFLAQAARNPLVYRVVPVVVLAVAAGAFTHWQDHDEPDGVAVVATGLSVALGYLALALVGTFAFTSTQTSGGATVVFHPGRVGTLLLMTAYPLVLGVVASIVVQAVGTAE